MATGVAGAPLEISKRHRDRDTAVDRAELDVVDGVMPHRSNHIGPHRRSIIGEMDDSALQWNHLFVHFLSDTRIQTGARNEGVATTRDRRPARCSRASRRGTPRNPQTGCPRHEYGICGAG